jgi:hypothetical protein
VLFLLFHVSSVPKCSRQKFGKLLVERGRSFKIGRARSVTNSPSGFIFHDYKKQNILAVNFASKIIIEGTPVENGAVR